MLDVKNAAQGYASVGSESRLAILLLLVKEGKRGLTISEIGSRLEMAPSTLAHHLRHLVGAGMVIQEKQGREVKNTAHFDHLEELGKFLLHECCSNERKTT